MDLLDFKKYQELKACDGFKERVFDNISAFSMSKKTSFSGLEGIESKASQARGLFVNNKTGEVVARGFDKFFNINENLDESGFCKIKKRFSGQVSIFKKENGYLGIVGYDSDSRDFVFTSKNSLDGEFAQRVKSLFYSFTSEEERVHIRHILKIKNACIVLEVVDVENDLHLVDYDESQLIIIGVLNRGYDFSEMSFDFVNKYFGVLSKIKIKELVSVSSDIDSAINLLKYKSFERCEGWVLNDLNGNYIKIKSDFYRRVRVLRSYIMAYRSKSGLSRFETPKDLYDYAEERLGKVSNHKELDSDERELVLNYIAVFVDNADSILEVYDARKGIYSFVETYAFMEVLAVEKGLKTFD